MRGNKDGKVGPLLYIGLGVLGVWGLEINPILDISGE